MEITKAFIQAVEMGAQDITNSVRDCESEVEKRHPGGAASPIIARLLEEKRQTADLLAGWAVRARKELGIEPKQ